MQNRIFQLIALVANVLLPVHRPLNADEPELSVFASRYLERGTQLTQLREMKTNTVSVCAAPGEYEPASITVSTSASEMRRVSVKLRGDFKSNRGDTISSATVQIRLVEPFERSRDRAYTIVIGDKEFQDHKHHDWLLPLFKQELSLAPHTARRFWLTVHVPDDAPPGTYRNEIVVEAMPLQHVGGPERAKHVQVLKYELTVLPIRLASAAETGMAFFMYNDTALYPAKLMTPEYQSRVLTDMQEHGMTTTTLYLYPSVTNGVADLTSATKSHLSFTQSMDLHRQTQLPGRGIPVIWIGAENYSVDVWKQVMEEKSRRKWPEILFYAVDEPGESGRNTRVHEFMDRFNAFRNQSRDDVRVTTAMRSSRATASVGRLYDVWIGSMAQAAGEKNPIADARALDKELWIYDCNLAPVDCEMDRYYFGIWAWVAGVKGCSHWAYFDGWSRYSYVYPTEEEIIPTIGWEAVREGVDDYRYLFTLKQLCEIAKAKGNVDLAKGGEQIFADVGAMVGMESYGRAYYYNAMCSAIRSEAVVRG